ncbi:MAG TPA: hypothetical protein VMI72_12705 [Roseiarcus sp.]|nr:hypothetical protein [Roseiarcus sp.]
MIARTLACLSALLASGIAPAAAQIAHAAVLKRQSSYDWRAVAGPTEIPMSKDTTNLQMMSRTPEFATDSISQIRVAFPNFFIGSSGWPDSGANAQPGNTATVTASIEYPAGTCAVLKFSGSSSGTIANGSFIVSDALSISIPNGAQFWVREFTTTPSGATVFGDNSGTDAGHYDAADGEKVIAAASGLTDYTSSCTAPNSWTGSDYGYPRKPIAVLGWTQHPAVCLIGDSRTRGAGDLTTGSYLPSNHWGQLDRWVGATFGTINLGANGDRAGDAVSDSAHFLNRGALLQYCTHAVFAYGINDINAHSASSANVESYFNTMQSMYDSTHRLVWYVATVYPYANFCPGGVLFSDSSGTGGYTPAQKEAQRLTYNTDARAVSISGQDGVVDIDAVVAESPWPGWTGGSFGAYAGCYATTTDTGLSRNTTSDGLHLLASGTYFVANAFLNAPGTFAGVKKPKPMFCTDKAGAYRC